MAVYPIRIPRTQYRGAKSNRRQAAAEENRIAADLEVFLNSKIEASEDDIQQYIYGFIAIESGYSLAIVRELLSRLGGGYNGITIRKRP